MKISVFTEITVNKEVVVRVLVCGASGFIGSAVCAQLALAGHQVLRGVRYAGQPGDVAIDYNLDVVPSVWLPRLREVDAAVNAVGIISEHGASRFDTLHAAAPIALFEACAEAGVRRVVQISALGAESGDTAYFTSKRAADEALVALPLEWTILRPSLVFGRDGDSTAMFCGMASMPIVVAPQLDEARFQPVHLDDLAQAVVAALDPATPARRVVECAGSSVASFDGMLAAYRRAMGLRAASVLHVPAWAMACAAWLGGNLPGVPLTPENWRMLRAGSALAKEDERGDAATLGELLGRAPRAIDDFAAPAVGELLRLRALARWRNALLRWSLAIVWMATAVVSAFIYPPEDSLAMLAHVGLEGWPAKLALYGAAALDAALGVVCIARPSRALWLAQSALVLGYSLVIAACLPEYLWHPFGPLLKNVPILAILIVLFAEEKSWTT
jgi:uncharacterized protein YbjT (DUF2867 family)